MEQTGNRTIAKNATMLYIRMFFTTAISFYTSRIVLQALGVSDYGIYNVVGGITVLLNVFIGALGNSTSRFLTYALGKGDIENLKKTFTTASWVHIGLALIFFVVAETLGLWFINTQLVIPDGRMTAANWVYQSAVISVIMGITQTPYTASVTSHERMSAFAYIEILLALCKLGIAAVVLLYNGDHLILYSILYALVSISFQCYYRYYCIKHFDECHINRFFDKFLFKEMLSFSSWTVIRSITLTLKNQGIVIFLNRFFGAAMNAAAGVALQVQVLLYAFTGNITLAFGPQITKSFAASNYLRANELINIGIKFTCLVTTLTTIPIIFNLDYLMSLWLTEVPSGSVVICQICLFSNFLNSFNPFFNRTIEASGKIKMFTSAMSLIYIAYFVFSYIVLKLTNSYIYVFIVDSTCCPIATLISIFILKRQLPLFSIRNFILNLYLPLFGLFAGSLCFAGCISKLISNPLLSFISITFFCSLFVLTISFYFIFNLDERQKIIIFFKSKLKKK